MGYYKRLGEATLVGVLLGVGFVVPQLWIAGLIGIAWSYAILDRQQRWLFGLMAYVWTIKYLFAVSWFWSVYPITWIPGIADVYQLPLVGFYWATVSIWLGFGGVGLVCLFRAAQRLLPSRLVPVAFPLVWVLAELLAAISFSLFTYGPGGAISTGFSFGMTGYLLAEHDVLVQAAQIGGVFILSSLAAVLGVLGWFWFTTARVWVLGGACCILLIGALVPLPVSVQLTPITSYRVASIDTAFPNDWWFTSEGMQAIREQQNTALQAALALDPDYIIFPEDSRFLSSVDIAMIRAILTWQAKRGDTPILIDSGRTTEAGVTSLQSFVYTPNSSQWLQSQKRYLVPQGEFLPYFYEGLLRLSGNGEAVAFLESELAYQVTDNTSQANWPQAVPGILFCFESNHPLGVRTILHEREQVPFIAHIVSHGWFNDPHVLWSQLDAMLRVQAVWNGVHVVSAGNHVAGRHVYPNGQIVWLETAARGSNWRVGLTEVPKLDHQ